MSPTCTDMHTTFATFNCYISGHDSEQKHSMKKKGYCLTRMHPFSMCSFSSNPKGKIVNLLKQGVTAKNGHFQVSLCCHYGS